jgi:hypothetical protein
MIKRKKENKMIEFFKTLEEQHGLSVNNEMFGYVQVLRGIYYALYVWDGKKYIYLPTDDFDSVEVGIERLKVWYMDNYANRNCVCREYIDVPSECDCDNCLCRKCDGRAWFVCSSCDKIFNHGKEVR